MKLAIFKSFWFVGKRLYGKRLMRIKLLRALYMFICKWLISREERIVNINDCTMVMQMRRGKDVDIAAQRLVFDGNYEACMTRVFRKIVRERMTVIDIGAHLGYYALLAARLVGPGGAVFAFEPEPRNYANLVRNIEVNKFTNVTAVQKAISDRSGKAKLFVSDDQSGECSLVEVECRPKKTVEVETTTLDSFFGNTPVDIIKVDVDGSEMATLLGADKLVRKNHRLKIFTEFWEPGLESAGYSCTAYWDKLMQCGFRYIYLIDERKQQVELVTLGDVLKYCHKMDGANLLCSKEEIA